MGKGACILGSENMPSVLTVNKEICTHHFNANIYIKENW